MSTQTAIVQQRRTGTGTVVCNICVVLTLSTILALGLIFWYSQVHAKIVFLQDPYLDKSNIPYYALMSDHDAARAQYWSFDGVLYHTDFLIILLLFATPAWFLIAICCHVRTIWPLTALYFLYGLWWLFKAVYLTFYWTNSTWLWSNFECDRYPFCRNRDISMDPSSADLTFIIEVISCYVIGVGGFVLGCILPSLWSGVRERQLYAMLQTDAPCENCGEKPRSLLATGDGGRKKKANASDDDSINSEFTADDQSALVVNRNTTTTATKRTNLQQQQQQTQRATQAIQTAIVIDSKNRPKDFIIPDFDLS